MGAGSPQVATSVRTALPAAMPTRALAADEVHLWIFTVSESRSEAGERDTSGMEMPLGPESYRDATPLASLASDAERERAARYRRPGDGARFLAAHGALRHVIGGYLGSAPGAVHFESGARGKPSIPGSPLCFNLSHSAALALIVVAHGRQVGVDVERQRSISDLEGIVTRICTSRERAALDRLDPSEREGAFLRLWTRKEALVKMTGVGIAGIGHDASLDTYDDCRLEQLTDLPGYAACIAARGTDWRLVRLA